MHYRYECRLLTNEKKHPKGNKAMDIKMSIHLYNKDILNLFRCQIRSIAKAKSG